MLKVKRWWQSKMYWFNISMAMSWIGIALTYINELGLEPEVAGWIGFGLAMTQSIGNILLRNVTNTGIGKPTPDEFTGA